MELLAYLILLVGPDLNQYVVRDGPCLPPAKIVYEMVACPSARPYQDGYERRNGRWTPRMIHPMMVTTGICTERVCVKDTKEQP